MKRGSAAELRPCLGQGASLGEEAVSADSGRAGEVTAGAGRVRRLAFLSTLRVCSPLAPNVSAIIVLLCEMVFPQPACPASLAFPLKIFPVDIQGKFDDI